MLGGQWCDQHQTADEAWAAVLCKGRPVGHRLAVWPPTLAPLARLALSVPSAVVLWNTFAGAVCNFQNQPVCSAECPVNA